MKGHCPLHSAASHCCNDAPMNVRQERIPIRDDGDNLKGFVLHVTLKRAPATSKPEPLALFDRSCETFAHFAGRKRGIKTEGIERQQRHFASLSFATLRS